MDLTNIRRLLDKFEYTEPWDIVTIEDADGNIVVLPEEFCEILDLVREDLGDYD
jgi:hypothetical protein